MNGKAYCPDCGEDVVFETAHEKRTGLLDGVEYEYEADNAMCPACGAYLDYSPYAEAAGMAFNDAVRNANGIVPLWKVRDLPKRYNIGKRPLSKLLGWGEITYTRFVDGVVPSKEYSQRIEALYEDPVAYRNLLQAGKSRIADVAFRKSMDAVESIVANDYPDAARLYEVADYMCAKAQGDLSQYSIQKLVYFAQGFSIPLLEKPLFRQMPRAWIAGPVYGQVWRQFKDKDLVEEYSGKVLSEETSVFSIEEERLLDAIYDAFGRYSGTMLSQITHLEGPWVSARNREGAEKGREGQEPLDLQDMEEFFSTVVEKFGLEGNLEGIRKYADYAAKGNLVLDCRS